MDFTDPVNIPRSTHFRELAMSDMAPSIAAAASKVQAGPDYRQRFYRGLTFILVLIALAVVISVVFPLLSGHVPNWSTVVSSWIWVPEVLIIIAVIAVIVWMSRTLRGGPEASDQYWHSRRYYRRHEMEGPPRSDPAVEIARQRFARGEITEDQLDQILGHLRRETGTYPPP
jgi:uncharacterized membrane protein